MREIIVTRAEAGQRFDRFLGKYMPGATAGFLHKMLRKKNIKLNGQKAEGSEKICEGDTVQIFFAEDTLRKFTGESGETADASSSRAGGERGKMRTASGKKRGLSREEQALRGQVRLLYSCADALIFHKPVGMLTQKAAKEDDSLNDYLLDYCRKEGIIKEGAAVGFRPSVANRLDRNTSGIVLCGITTVGLQNLARLLRERGLEKYYLCIVQGVMREGRKIRGYLRKDEEKNTVTLLKGPAKDAEPVETWYQVMDTGTDATLLKVRLITGKSHQIRAHLASEGHPVLGDYKYGNRQANDMLKKKTGISYQLLHSYEVKIPKERHIIKEAEHTREKMPDCLAEWRGLDVIDAPPEEFLRAMEVYGLSLRGIVRESRQGQKKKNTAHTGAPGRKNSSRRRQNNTSQKQNRSKTGARQRWQHGRQGD